tara:strand:+ start:12943 stop:13353 length:411 start_codon:yes stop_codon:yes gene_type:complete
MVTRTRDDAGRLREVKPPDFLGSEPEFFIFRALQRRGMVEGIHFAFQSAFFGGRQTRGGAIVDFFVRSPRVGINVQSEFFHQRTSAQRANDALQRIAIESSGLRVEFISEDDARNRPDEAVAEALAGTRGRGPIGA